MTYPIPNDALDDRLAVVGATGSGKSYMASGAVERILIRKGRVVVVDPLGVWFGLRLMPDGKTPSPFNPVVFGGPHGDLPIGEHAGALIGETVAGMAESCIVDLSEIGTKNGERRFMLAFLTALYRKSGGDLVHLVIDEADMFAPQKLDDKEGEAAKLLGMMETIVRRGRVRGFIPWLITQRPAVLNKNVLSQADGVVAMKLTGEHDRRAIGGWIEGQSDLATSKAILASLPSKQKGEAVLWIPGRSILDHVQFPVKQTFDSSRAPKRGEKKHSTALKPIDLGSLKERLATVEEEIKANDPKALKAKIAELQKQLTNIPKNTPDQKAVDEAINHGYGDGYADGVKEGEAKGYVEGCKVSNTDLALLEPALEALIPGMRMLQDRFEQALRNSSSRMNSPIPRVHKEPIPQNKFVSTGLPKAQSHVKPITKTNGSNSGQIRLPPGERAVLVAAAQFGSVERDQLTVLTGYKRSTRDAYIQRLREKGLIEISGQTIKLTDEGGNALPSDYEPLPTGQNLQEYWLNRLPEGERRILQSLIEEYPKKIDRSDLDELTGYKRSSRDAYIQRMKAKRLVSISGSSISASEELF